MATPDSVRRAKVRCSTVAALFALALLQASLSAADLSAIPRTIARQPEYQSQEVEYCLLVFGPEAATRVWLVRDGRSLYVDRNANGDLTDDGPPVAADGERGTDDGDYFGFTAGDIEEGELTHRYLYVSVMGEDRRVYLQVQMPGHTGTGVGGRVRHTVYSDPLGTLRFTATPQTAPIIHFRGPLAITLCGKYELTRDRQIDFYTGVGTLGLGRGASAFVEYENLIPRSEQPVVEITYPAGAEREKPIRKLYELKQRC